jgi:hypothetical protein
MERQNIIIYRIYHLLAQSIVALVANVRSLSSTLFLRLFYLIRLMVSKLNKISYITYIKFIIFNGLQLLIFIRLLLLSSSVQAQAPPQINLEIIKQIESSGNIFARSSAGAKGLFQLTKICVQDYNQFHQSAQVDFDSPSIYTPSIQYKIASWYINERCPQLLKHFGLSNNTTNILICYNAGIGWAIKHNRKGISLPKETENYVKSYNKRKERTE